VSKVTAKPVKFIVRTARNKINMFIKKTKKLPGVVESGKLIFKAESADS